MIADTTTLTSEHTDTMSLIDHDRAVVLVLQLYDGWQICKIALHREHTIHHDELDGLIRQLLQHTLQILHVVVLIMELLGK